MPEPIPMLLTCPACSERHIDVGEFAIKPHHTHACQHCRGSSSYLDSKILIEAFLRILFYPSKRDTTMKKRVTEIRCLSDDVYDVVEEEFGPMVGPWLRIDKDIKNKRFVLEGERTTVDKLVEAAKGKGCHVGVDMNYENWEEEPC